MLDDSAEEDLGELLYLTTDYGWGWSRKGVGTLDVPSNFEMRLERLWWFDGERRGGVGRIEHENHSLDGNWVVFSTRVVGTFNFRNLVGNYNVTVGFDCPKDSEGGWPIFKRYLNDDGFGTIQLASQVDA